MAYSVDDIDSIAAWTATSYAADDIVLDQDNLACMTNGTNNENCDEIKEGTINLKIGIDTQGAEITSLSIRFFLESIMAAGNNAVTPYTDSNSVSTTNEDIETYGSGEVGTWIEHVLSAALIAQLAVISGIVYVRLSSSDATAKSKIGEVNVDVVVVKYPLAGITKDKDGSVLVSCEVALFEVIGEGPPTTYEFVESQTSNGTTGAYSFQVPNVSGSPKFMVMSIKDNTPHVFDCTDNVLVGDTS